LDKYFLLLPEVQEWINQNLHQNVATLALKASPFPKEWMTDILEQLQSKQKAKLKLPTWYHKPGVLFPKGISVEQTSSEITASFKGNLIQGNILVDVTGGFGIDAFFFAKSFSKVYHVEQQEVLSAVVKHNCEVLEQENIQCMAQNSREFLEQFTEPIDVIYADPARRDVQKNKVFLLEDCEPNVLEELDFWLQKAKQVLLKTSPMLDISLGIEQLQKVAKIWIITLDNEVKELLWLLQNNTTQIDLEVVHLYKNQIFSDGFPWSKTTTIDYLAPQKYLYEPHAGWMKSGKMDVYANQLGLSKLAPHSHLYTSEVCLENFHGRVFEVLAYHAYDKAWMKQQLQGKEAAITVRNFPEKVEELRKKWKIKESHQQFVFFTTLHNDQKIVLICKKINS
jgi:16S rRNA G966 N2-methylase RsmD